MYPWGFRRHLPLKTFVLVIFGKPATFIERRDCLDFHIAFSGAFAGVPLFFPMWLIVGCHFPPFLALSILLKLFCIDISSKIVILRASVNFLPKLFYHPVAHYYPKRYSLCLCMFLALLLTPLLQRFCTYF